MNEEPPQITDTPVLEPTFEVLAPEPGPKLRHALTLSNLWHVWIGLRGGAPNTVEQRQFVAKRFCKFFGHQSDRSIHHKLTPQGMVEWMQALQKYRIPTENPTRKPRPLSAARINKINTIVRAFLRWMRKMKYVGDDLADCIPTLMQPGPKPSVIFTEEEYETLKAYCAGRPHYQTHLWLMILGYRTGMSLIDCCHLRWRDVHLHDNEPSYIEITRIKIQRFGTKARCQIPIVPFSDIHLWLLNLRNAPQWKRFDGITDYVHNETEALYHCTFGRLRQDFKTICRQAGVDPAKTFKCFRNSLCSNLVNSGMQLAMVCQVTGHNSVQTLLRYLHPDRRALQDSMAKAQQYSAQKAGIGKGSDGMQTEDSAFL